jgi:hypothetical protein
MPAFIDQPEEVNGSPFCYQIDIDTNQTPINAVEFQYTDFSSNQSTIVQASNWFQSQNGSIVTLAVCSTSQPLIRVYGDYVFDPGQYDITVSGGFTSCFDHNECVVGGSPVNCVLSDWGYGETQESFVVGAWGPCRLINGSYQEQQTRYVVTPASNGGECIGETVRYQACTPPQTGTVATLTTPTFSSITATSVIATTTISNNGGSTVTSVQFKLFKNGTQVGTQTLTDFSLGISVQFNGLIAGSAYTLTAAATNSTGVGTSPTGSFSTVGASTITTPTISAITQTSAISTSTFTNSGGDAYVRYGVIYKLDNSTNLEIGQPGVVRFESGPFNSGVSPSNLVTQLSGLTANRPYYLKAYLQGSDGSYLYSSFVTFTTSSVPQGQNLASLSIAAEAISGSVGTSQSYSYITASAANQDRTYVSIIEQSPDDPIPGVYKISANLQQVNAATLFWTIQQKTSPGETDWQNVAEVTTNTDLNSLPEIPGFSYYQYGQGLISVSFRPRVPGYYRFGLKGAFENSVGFQVYEEVVVGEPISDTYIANQLLRQGISGTIQVGATSTYPEWIPEFSEDSLYGITVTQTGSTVIPLINVNNSTRSFTALWGVNPAYESITPTLTINYTSPFKNTSLSNSFSKQFQVEVLAPFPTVSFSNPGIFSSPVTSGSNVTINVSTQYAKTYTISSSLGTGSPDSPVTYTTVPTGTYTITATAVNDNMPTAQTSTVTATLTVQPPSPILAQIPQQIVSRNTYVDINTLPYVNLNGSSFNGFEIVTQPSQGTLSILNYGIRYIPTSNYTGTDLFAIRVKGPNAVVSNTINVSTLVSAPSFNVGTANETIVFNSTEVGADRDLTVPITNTSTGTNLEIASISIDQDGDEFKLVLGSGQTENVVAIINNITITPGNTYSVKIRVQPSSIGVRSAKLKIDHN